MALEVVPSRVPQGGRSPRAAATVAVLALASIVGFAVLGKTSEGAAPWSPPPEALASPAQALTPSSAPSRTTAVATATPEPPCVPPRILALSDPIARHPRPLAATGFATVTPWTGAEGFLVADHAAGFWAFGSGRLTRLDSGGRIIDSWTFADDPAFGASGIVAAGEGGVWLWGGRTIAWFDGRRFPDSIASPGGVVDIAEAPDGSLWAATYDGGVFHWDGGSWTDVCGRPTRAEISHLAIDADGGLWVAPNGPTSVVSVVSYFDGTGWSTPPSKPGWSTDLGGPNASSSALVAPVDGSVWWACGGVAHFDGKAWTGVPHEGVDLSGTVSLAVSPAGTVWAATGSVTLPGDAWGPRSGIHVARFDGRSWTVYDSADGLPAPDPSSWATITAVAASRDAVVAATGDGFYRLSGGRWVRTGPRSASADTSSPNRLLAVSSGEVWASGWDAGLWHIRDDVPTAVQVAGWASPLPIRDLALAPDGTLAVATDRGAAVRRKGHWTVLAEGGAGAVTFAGDGTLWVAGQTPDSPETTVASFRFEGRAWVRTAYPSLTAPGVSQIAVGPDGEPWVGSGGYFGSLDRFDRSGASWVHVSPAGASEPVNVTDLATASDGDLWVALTIGGGADSFWAIARYDGAGWTVWRTSDIVEWSRPSGYEGPHGAGVWGGLAFTPDGDLWAGTEQGLLRFDGRQWSHPFAGYSFSALSVAPDGTLWAVGPSGVARVQAGTLDGWVSGG